MASQTENVLSLISAIFTWVDNAILDVVFTEGGGDVSIEIQVEPRPYGFRIVGRKSVATGLSISASPLWVHIPETDLPIAKMVVVLVNRYINNK